MLSKSQAVHEVDGRQVKDEHEASKEEEDEHKKDFSSKLQSVLHHAADHLVSVQPAIHRHDV